MIELYDFPRRQRTIPQPAFGSTRIEHLVINDRFQRHLATVLYPEMIGDWLANQCRWWRCLLQIDAGLGVAEAKVHIRIILTRSQTYDSHVVCHVATAIQCIITLILRAGDGILLIHVSISVCSLHHQDSYYT